MKLQLWAIALITALAGANVACSVSTEHKHNLRRSELALKNAEFAGAEQYAPLEFRRASEKLLEARTALQKRDLKHLSIYIAEAEVDARLAEVKSNALKSSLALQELSETASLWRGDAAINR